MAKARQFEGSMVALVTPFRNGKIDRKALRGLLDFHLRSGTDVLIPCGTTGESATMSHDEHRRLMSIVVEYVDGRAPVICGAGSNNTEEALGLVRYARRAKADGVLVVTPYYNKPTQEGLYRHYQYLASKVDIPMVLYNVPGRTGVSLSPHTVARLAKIDTVVAVKEASGDLGQVDEILSLCDITVLSGDDGLTFPMMAIGARGVISVTANIVPIKVRAMVHRALKGDMVGARALHQEMYELAKVLFVESNPIPVKTALGMMRKIKPELRLPLCAMTKANQQKLRKVLKTLGVIQ
ncbi:MAG: 4-hydroxy-tetrahydrodipicolinate synthase [Candidatus Omnitrophota bacterium]|nr:4-hydroxy-tetrahydrodipicolinate synthase [Candidatus Omnitrophota bacterium]